MKEKNRKRNYLWLILLILSVLVFLISSSVLISGYVSDISEENEFESLAKQVDTTLQSTPLENDSKILEKYAYLFQENPDIGGWISIEGTKVDYPVMFTPNDPEKYLHLSFSGKYSKSGVPFIGQGCSINPRSDNIIVFGHHMKNGSMFATLENYKNAKFWDDHRTIHFDTIFDEGTYEVFAVIETDVNNAENLRCYSFINAKDEADFNEYIANILNAAMYNTNISVKYGDELLTLSTCSYNTEDGRLIVVAKNKRIKR